MRQCRLGDSIERSDRLWKRDRQLLEGIKNARKVEAPLRGIKEIILRLSRLYFTAEG